MVAGEEAPDVDQEQRRRVLEEAMKGMSPAERQRFVDQYSDYVYRRENKMRTKRDRGDFMPAISSLKDIFKV